MRKKLLRVGIAILTFSMVLFAPTVKSFADKDSEEPIVEDTEADDSKPDDEIVEFEEEMICNGVFIENLEIGGKSATEAKDIVTKYLNDILDKKVTVKANGKEASISAKDLGAKFAEADYVDQALNIGKFGNVVRRYKDLKDVENDKKVYKVEVNFDSKKVKEFVEKKATDCNIEPKEPSLHVGGRLPSSNASSSFSITDGQIGKCIDEVKLAVDLDKKLKDWNKEDIALEAEVTETKPKHSADELRKCNDRIAQFTTNYSSSGSSRCKNIATATSKIDGSLVYPGEEFSILSKIAPFTKSNGYAEAGSYSQGKVVDSLGGGVCQVSTTLYNAVLRAELNVTMRNNHSMVVSYVPISADAMIASSASRDFKFKNNTKAPVYIEAYTSGKNVTFNIYGQETRPSNRTLKFENKILKTLQPGKEVITKDSSKPKSYREVTQSAHVGYKAEYYKIVCINGVEKQRIKVNSSYYQAAPKYITVGTKEEVKATPNPDDSEIMDEDTPNVNVPVKPTAKPSTPAKPTVKPTVPTRTPVKPTVTP